MSGSLAPLMLRIAAAVDGDGGAGVRRALQDALQDKAAFDGGELVYARIPGEHASFLLGDAREAFLGSDLVEHVLAEGAPFRIDDWRDAAAFPDTLARLRRLGLRSVLVLPFRFEEPEGPRLRGALAVARRHGWAFVGASLHVLGPLAGLAGLAFDQALRLSALGDAPQAFLAPRPQPAAPLSAPAPVPPEPIPGDPETETLRGELEAARHDAARAALALREAEEAARGFRSSLEAADAARLEAERSRDDWAQQAASQRARNDGQEAEMRELKRAMAGARETAAASADMAQASEGRLHELEAELQRVGQERDRARREADEALEVAARATAGVAPGDPTRSSPRREPDEAAGADPPSTDPPTPAGAASEPPLPGRGFGRHRSRRHRQA